jgi:hypothetical protein
MADILVKEFTYKTSWQGETYSVQIFGDGTFIRKNGYTVVEPTEQSFLDKFKKSIDESGITAPDGTHYKLDPSSKESTIEQVREEWSKYNEDKASKLAFGEAKSPDMNFAKNIAKNNAIQEFGKKQNTQNYTVKGAVITKEKLYSNSDKTYSSLMVVEVDAVIPDKAVTEQDTGGNSATLDDTEATVITGTTEAEPDVEFPDYFSSARSVRGKAIKNGKTYIAGGYLFYTNDTESTQKEIWERIYDDIAEKIFNDEVKKDETLEDKYQSGYSVKTRSFKFTTVPPNRPKDKPKPATPPPPITPAPPPAAVKKTPVVYQPKTRVTKAKSTRGGEFVEKISGKDYKGPYITAYKSKYYAGSNLDQNGVELIPAGTKGQTIVTPALALLFSSLQGFFKKKASSADREKGSTKRFFMQTKKDNKIVELDKSNFQQAQLALPTQNFAQVDWMIKGPAEDKVFNGYPFEGAESKNKKAILALEKQIPGISTFIKDYKFLVEDPAGFDQVELETQVVVRKDLQTGIDNSRKANFDLRK